MTVFHCDGFETYGDTGTSGATVQANIQATDKTRYIEASGGFTNPPTLIDDFETVGQALQFDTLDASRGEFVEYEFPDGTGRFADYKISTNSSVTVFVTGWRLYNGNTDPAQAVRLWEALQGSGSVLGSRLERASNGVDLIWTPTSGGATTISGVLTVDTWHYIEVEWKATNAANGGYVTIYVDGVEVADITGTNVASGTFFTTYGDRIGVQSSSNDTGGTNFAIDDVYHLALDGSHTGPLGPCRVFLLNPTSDASPNDWTPSAGGDNYALIDERDWDTADYVDATATGNDDHYGLSTLTADTVHGIQIDVVCVAVDGTPTLHIGTHDGSNSDEESMGVIATGSPVQKRMFFEVDPAGGAWSVADVNAVEATQRMTE